MRRAAVAALALAAAQAAAQIEQLMPALGAIERGDYAQAIDVLKPLAQGGDTEAQYLLATVLERAAPPLGDPQAAYGWYRRAAEAGYAPAQVNLGAMHFDGRGGARKARPRRRAGTAPRPNRETSSPRRTSA